MTGAGGCPGSLVQVPLRVAPGGPDETRCKVAAAPVKNPYRPSAI